MLYLPEDLLEEILSRVPVTSLKRLRATCKRWNRLFSDKRFRAKHFDTAAKQSLVLAMLTKKLSICSMSVNLNGSSSVQVISELKLNNSRFGFDHFEMSTIFHCDGLLLCTNQGNTRLVVWNPCTGQTRWIQPSNHHDSFDRYTLGSYHDKESGNNSYKILRYRRYGGHRALDIYEFNSNSWRILYIILDCTLISDCSVSLKGKSYWFALKNKEYQRDMFLVSFDYTTERFSRMSLPYSSEYDTVSLSVVREDELLVLLQRKNTRGREVWVANKNDEWSKVLTVDYPQCDRWVTLSFVFNEEKKLALCCEKRAYKVFMAEDTKDMVYILGEDNKITQVDFGEATLGSCGPVILNYVPSLVQIQ